MVQQTQTEPHVRLEILSQPRYLCGAREMVSSLAKRVGFDDLACSQIALALDEALANVMRHGYGGRADGRIWLSFWPLDNASADGAPTPRARSASEGSPPTAPPAPRHSGAPPGAPAAHVCCNGAASFDPCEAGRANHVTNAVHTTAGASTGSSAAPGSSASSVSGASASPGSPRPAAFGGPMGIRLVIEDEAKQVDPDVIKGRDLEDIRPGGLGVHIIKHVMDTVRYEKRDGKGMRLTMEKRM